MKFFELLRESNFRSIPPEIEGKINSLANKIYKDYVLTDKFKNIKFNETELIDQFEHNNRIIYITLGNCEHSQTIKEYDGYVVVVTTSILGGQKTTNMIKEIKKVLIHEVTHATTHLPYGKKMYAPKTIKNLGGDEYFIEPEEFDAFGNEIKDIIINNKYPDEIYEWAIKNLTIPIPVLLTGITSEIKEWMSQPILKKKLVSRIISLYQNKG